MAECGPLQMPPAKKAVLMAMAYAANEARGDGRCWLSVAALSERTCFERSAVIDAIAWLEASGIVVAERRPGTTTVYIVIPASFNPDYDTTSRREAGRNQSGRTTSRAEPPVGQTDGGSRAEPLHQSGRTTAPVVLPDPNKKEQELNQKLTRSADAREDEPPVTPVEPGSVKTEQPKPPKPAKQTPAERAAARIARKAEEAAAAKATALALARSEFGERLAGVPDDTLGDWITARGPKAAITGTVLKALEREGGLVGLTLCDTIRYCAEKNWRGFNADWWRNDMQRIGKSGTPKGTGAHHGYDKVDYRKGVDEWQQ